MFTGGKPGPSISTEYVPRFLLQRFGSVSCWKDLSLGAWGEYQDLPHTLRAAKVGGVGKLVAQVAEELRETGGMGGWVGWVGLVV